MKFFKAKKQFEFIKRKSWVGQFIDSAEHGLPIHRLPGMAIELTTDDVMADDWEEFKMPVVGNAVI